MNSQNWISVGSGTLLGIAAAISDLSDYAFRAVLEFNNVSDPASCLSWFKDANNPFNSSRSCYPVTDLASLHRMGAILTFVAVGLIIWKAVDFFMHTN